MAFEITQKALDASKQIDLKPNIILKIEGVSDIYGAVEILEVAKYGSGVTYGQSGLVYGGSVAIQNQGSYISFSSGGTSSTIRQTLQVDKGLAESVSGLTVALIDKNQEITNLITPGKVVPEILGRRVKVYFGFANTNYPDDYIIIFRGIIQSVESLPGTVKFNLSHPDQKKRSEIFNPASTALTSAMGAGDTVANVSDASDFLEKITGPAATIDGDFRTYIRVDDEIMEYQTTSATQFQTLTRGALGTTAASHSSGADVVSLYRIGGASSNAIDLSLKLMSSGENTFQFTDIPITNFVRISASETVANAIFFDQVNVVTEYNFQVGDFIETTGASNGANNVSGVFIQSIEVVSNGSYVVVDSVSFVEENNTSALLKVRSQYDVWPDGLRMKPDEIDYAEHFSVKNTFFPDAELDFYLQSEVNGKEFLSQQIYNVIGAFSLPRKSQASVGVHSPPLPNQDIVQLDSENIIDPSKLTLQRSTNKNITNTVLYKHDESALDEGTFTKNTLSIDDAAFQALGVGRRSIVIESKGLRDSLGATVLATAAASRRLKKYARGAEYLKSVQLHFRDGFKVEVGDKVLLDFTSLQLTDIQSGTRAGDSRIMTIDNKVLDLKTGNIKLDLTDDNFDKSSRFGLVAPSSVVKSATDGLNWVIQSSFASRFGANEFRKWEGFIGATVRIVSPDFVARSGFAVLTSVNGNSITVATSVGFTPVAGDYMLYSKYSDQVLENVKTIYVHLSDDVNNFADGKVFYGLF